MSHDKTCWICGGVADSREHAIKRDDLTAFVGRIPFFVHTNERTNLKVQGPRSKEVMFDAPICAYCNGTRTQPHDVAWSKLADHIRTLGPAYAAGSRIDLEEVFPGTVTQGLRDIQLFFVKLTGCKLNSREVDGLRFESLDKAIMTGEAHPCIWLKLIAPSFEFCGQTEFCFEEDKPKDVAWTYGAGHFAVEILYKTESIGELSRILSQTGYRHPDTTYRYLPIMDLRMPAPEPA